MTLTADNLFNLVNDAKVTENLGDLAGRFAIRLLISVVIFVIAIWLSRLLSRLTRRALSKILPFADSDSTFANFVSSVVRYGVLAAGVIAVFAELGMKTTSIIAVLGAASLTVGLALQGTLGNVAAGVMLLMLRPYRVGDLVELAGRTGKVLMLDLFVTVLDAADGLRLTIPNGKIFGEVIVNYTTTGKRRVELKFGLDYEDDLDCALEVILNCARADKRVLAAPEPWAKVTALQDSSVTCTLDCWVASVDYLNTGPDLLKACKEALEAAGLHFPYPHQVAVSRDQAMGREALSTGVPVERVNG